MREDEVVAHRPPVEVRDPQDETDSREAPPTVVTWGSPSSEPSFGTTVSAITSTRRELHG